MKNTMQWTDHVSKQHDGARTNFEKDKLLIMPVEIY